MKDKSLYELVRQHDQLLSKEISKKTTATLPDFLQDSINNAFVKESGSLEKKETTNVIHVNFSRQPAASFPTQAFGKSDEELPWYVVHREMNQIDEQGHGIVVTFSADIDSDYISVSVDAIDDAPESFAQVTAIIDSMEGSSLRFGIYSGEQLLAEFEGEVNEERTYLYGKGRVIEKFPSEDLRLDIRFGQ